VDHVVPGVFRVERDEFRVGPGRRRAAALLSVLSCFPTKT
jgi:hypothetical protein